MNVNVSNNKDDKNKNDLEQQTRCHSCLLLRKKKKSTTTASGAAESPSPLPGIPPSLYICKPCQAYQQRTRIQRALDSWDMFPPPLSSTVWIGDHSSGDHDERNRNRKRRRVDLPAVPIGKLPTITSYAVVDIRTKRQGCETREDGRIPTVLQQQQQQQQNNDSSGTAAKPVDEDVIAVAGAVASACAIAATTDSKGDIRNDNQNKQGEKSQQQQTQQQEIAQPKSTQKTNNIDLRETDPLLGATIRIKKGKFDGYMGTIIECQNIRSVVLKSIPNCAFRIDDVKIIQSDNGEHVSQTKQSHEVDTESMSKEDLVKMYQGAMVRVVPHNENICNISSSNNNNNNVDKKNSGYNAGGEILHEQPQHMGKIGRVTRVIAGKWYITDNPKISNAFQSHKFEVLRYGRKIAGSNEADGPVANKAKEVDRTNVVDGSSSSNNINNGNEKQEAGTKVDMRTASAAKDYCSTQALETAIEKNEDDLLNLVTKACSTQVLETAIEKNEDDLLNRVTKALGGRRQTQQQQGRKLDNNDGGNDAVDSARDGVIPPSNEVGSNIISDANNNSGTASESKGSQELTGNANISGGKDANGKDLMGATICIKQGRYAGQTAVIGEKQTLQRLRLDTIRTPLLSSEVEIGAKANSTMQNDDQTLGGMCMHDYVRLKKPERFGGVEGGRIVSLASLGDWYIVNDPQIKAAFPERMFDVMEYASSAAQNDGGSGGVIKKKANDETKRDSGVNDVEGDANIVGKAERNNERGYDTVRSARNEIIPSNNQAGSDFITTNNNSGTASKSRGSQELTGNANISGGKDANDKDLIGATIRIKQGPYAGQTAVIEEKQTLQRIELDTIRTPLLSSEVEIVAKANNTMQNDDQTLGGMCMHEYVRLKEPERYGGIEGGRIVSLASLGDWYIVNDPQIKAVFPDRMFDVMEYASSAAQNDGGSGGVIKKKANDETKRDSGVNDVEGDANIVGKAERSSSGMVEAELIQLQHDSNKDISSKVEKSSGTKLDYIAPPELHTFDNQNKNEGKCIVGRENSSRKDNVTAGLRGNFQGPPSVDALNSKCVNKKDSHLRNARSVKEEEVTIIDKEEVLKADSKHNVLEADSKHDVIVGNYNGSDDDDATEIRSLQLPTIENIEMAARLSAFDSFLFLADGFQTDNEVGEHHIESGAPATGNVDQAKEVTSTTAASTPDLSNNPTSKSNEQQSKQTDGSSSASISHTSNNSIAFSSIAQHLIKQKRQSHSCPIVKVLPGTEVLAGEAAKDEEQQPSFRMVPLQEQIVRTIPGGHEESEDLTKRLGAFDDFFFLIDGK